MPRVATMTDEVRALIAGRCRTAFGSLGIHPLGDPDDPGRVVRVFVTWAATIELLRLDRVVGMDRIHDQGLFEAQFPEETEFFPYQLRITDRAGKQFVIDDPYRLLPVLDEDALAGFFDGSERRAHRFFGARVIRHQGLSGTCFSVWAPSAHNVNLMGEFNRWDARCHPMRFRGSTGVWELFIPGVGHGTHYKFDIRPQDERLQLDKADPFGRAMELRPQTAARVWTPAPYPWRDQKWTRNRETRHDPATPLSVYEVHPGSWRRKAGADPAAGRPGWLTYRELADQLIPYVREQGFTHIQLLPLAEHPLDASWGYQTMGYFAPTSRYGTPDDFRYFVDRAHEHEIGVLVDWTPAHFPRDSHGLARFDGTRLFEYSDPVQSAHPDWGTLIFDYGRPEVVSFLLSSAIFWLEEFHVDGLRVDAVASMLYLDYSRKPGEWRPNKFGGRENLEAAEFLRALTKAVHEECPGAIVIAEESTTYPKVSHPIEYGGLGFDYKWNLGWMNDTLQFMRAGDRRQVYHKLTFSIWYASSERFMLPLSHDEVVHRKGSLFEKMPGTHEQRLAGLRLLYAYMWAHPGKKLLFMGGELGQPWEWNFEGDLAWDLVKQPGHQGVQHTVRELNRLYRSLPALHELDLHPDGFEWLECHDVERTTLAFIRWAKEWKTPIVVAGNFAPNEWKGYRLAVPFEGHYHVCLNTASPDWGAQPAHDLPQSFAAVPGELSGRQYYIEFDFPPLTAIYFEWEPITSSTDD